MTKRREYVAGCPDCEREETERAVHLTPTEVEPIERVLHYIVYGPGRKMVRDSIHSDAYEGLKDLRDAKQLSAPR